MSGRRSRVALNTGLRQGNEFHLRWTDVNFDTGTITVRQSKSGESYHVPMNDEVRAVLRDLPSRLRSEWVFPSETGQTPLDAKNYMHRVFNPAVKKARIAGFARDDPPLRAPVARASARRGTTFDPTAN